MPVIIDEMLVGNLLLFIMFLFYNYLIFELVGQLLENPRLKKKCRVAMGVLNSGIAVLIYLNLITMMNSFVVYTIFYLFLFIEFFIFHRDLIRRVFFVASACILHIMAFRAIVVSSMAIAMKASIPFVVSSGLGFIFSTAITFFVLDVIIILVMCFVPMDKVRIINQHDEQLCFMTVWLVATNIFLLINAKIYSSVGAENVLLENQIYISVLLLVGVYFLLFFTIKTGDILGYKEKNEKLKQAIYNEQQYRESVTSDAISVYEFNLTKDIFLNGLEEYWTLFHLETVKDLQHSYTKILTTLSRVIVHPDDLEAGLEAASPETFIREYNNGKSETNIEYRRLMSNGEYIWVRATTNIVKDMLSGDLIGFTYIKDINMEKQIHLTLQYNAERDSLTGLYNKGVTAQKIEEYLELDVARQKKSALLIIDVDNFKSVNDHLGHTFGDAVLSDLSTKLTANFRGEDIIGRIGGDEFIVFLKNTPDMNLIYKKAAAICSSFRNTYKGNDDLEYAISASIGIALYPMHGKTFEELYKSADIALYNSKNEGKNIYKIYNGEDFSCYESNRTEIDNISFLPQKNFTKNRIEYVFKILFGSENSAGAIHTVLELLASNYNFSRGYIFETSEDGLLTSNTFEWCSYNIKPQIQNLKNLPIEAVATSTKAFYDTGKFILKDLRELEKIERDVLEPQGIKSMLQFGIFEKDKLLGFIGFDDCQAERISSDEEIEELSTICNILASFIVKQRAVERAENQSRALTVMMNNLDNYAFVIDKSSYKLLFANDKANEMLGLTDKSNFCYEVFRGEDAPCHDCPFKTIGDDLQIRLDSIFLNQKFDMWLAVSISNINWINGERAALISYRPTTIPE